MWVKSGSRPGPWKCQLLGVKQKSISSDTATTSHLATGYWAATMQGVQKRPLCSAAGEPVEIMRQGGELLAGRWGVVREEKSDVVVFVSSGKSQHDDGLGAGAITSERAPMSAFGPFRSALPPTSDILGEAANVSR